MYVFTICIPPGGSLPVTPVQNVGFSGPDTGAEPRALHNAMAVFLGEKCAPGMLPFRDSFAPVADQDPWEPGGRINCWFSDAVSALEYELFTTAWPDLPFRRAALENPYTGGFLALHGRRIIFNFLQFTSRCDARVC